jgi:hypothetical protein
VAVWVVDTRLNTETRKKTRLLKIHVGSFQRTFHAKGRYTPNSRKREAGQRKEQQPSRTGNTYHAIVI